MRSFKLLLVVLLCAVPAVAESVYQVSGDIILTGNNACSGPCVETIKFSFDLEYGSFPPYGPSVAVLPGATTQSFGPLASFVGPSSTTAFVPYSLFCCQYIGFFNSFLDEIDLDVVANSSSAPQITGADLYGCGTFQALDPTCVADFVPPNGSPVGTFLGATVQATVTEISSVPEESTVVDLLAGLCLLWLILRYRSKGGCFSDRAAPRR